MKRIATVAVSGLALAGCAQGAPTTGPDVRSQAFVLTQPTATRSPSVFVAGEPTTEKLASGQRVSVLMAGPALANPVKGQPVQFAPTLVETFTVTATVAAGPAVTFTPASFVLHRAVGSDAAMSAPASVVVRPGHPQTWRVSSIQTPGQGEIVWHDGGIALGSWSFVAEND